MNSIAEKIYRLIRERSLGTDLSSLKQRGVKRVSVFKSNQLGDLVGMAVEQVLTEYGIRLSQGDMAGLSEDGRAAFLRLLKERNAYKEVADRIQKEQETLQIHRDVLKKQIEREGNLLEDEKDFWSKIPLGEEADSLPDLLGDVVERTIQKRIERLGAASDPLLVKFLEDVAEGLTRELAAATAGAFSQLERYHSDGGQKRIRTLERRVLKMRESLNRAEAALAQVEEAHPEDRGMASVYRSVQGLNPDERDYERKKQMLADIFQLNKNIKEQIR